MKRIIPAIIIILLITLACISSSGDSSIQKENLKLCLDIKDIVVVPGTDFSEVQGWVENNCSEDIYAVKVVATGYKTQDGSPVASDEEYIEDIAVGDKKYFEALVDDPNGEIKFAKVVTDEVYQP